MSIKKWWMAGTTALSSLMLVAMAWAQQSGADLDVNVTTQSSSPWYGQWYVWAIGVGVFLILVIALTNRGSRQT